MKVSRLGANTRLRGGKGKKKTKKKNLLNRGLEPLLSPSPGMQSVLDPVEPPRLDSKLKVLIAGYIVPPKCVGTPSPLLHVAA